MACLLYLDPRAVAQRLVARSFKSSMEFFLWRPRRPKTLCRDVWDAFSGLGVSSCTLLMISGTIGTLFCRPKPSRLKWGEGVYLLGCKGGFPPSVVYFIWLPRNMWGCTLEGYPCLLLRPDSRLFKAFGTQRTGLGSIPIHASLAF